MRRVSNIVLFTGHLQGNRFAILFLLYRASVAFAKPSLNSIAALVELRSDLFFLFR